MLPNRMDFLRNIGTLRVCENLMSLESIFRFWKRTYRDFFTTDVFETLFFYIQTDDE